MADRQQEKLATLIDRVYQAAVQPRLWRTVLHELSLALGAEGCHPSTYRGSANFAAYWSEGVDELTHTFIRESWAQRNPRIARGQAQFSPKAVLTESDIFTPEELDRLPFNAEFINRLGFRWFASALLAKADCASIFLTVERRQEQGAFTESEISEMERLVPHVRRAAQLALGLGARQAEGMLDAFEEMGCGGILIDFSGRVLRFNRKVQQHLGRGIGLAHRQVAASDHESNTALQRLIGSILQPGAADEAPARGAVVLPRSSGLPLILHATPIAGSADDVFQHARAILMLVDPDEHAEPSEALLHQAFGLTRSETQIAVGLAQGLDLQDIADSRGISIATARVHLRNLFAKTGTHRQAELVALLARMAVAPRMGRSSPLIRGAEVDSRSTQIQSSSEMVKRNP
jgi:DNA-binding CsgD family transcriptional regulator